MIPELGQAAFILGIYGGAVAVFGHTLRESLQARVQAVQGVVGASVPA